jgi:hypothetical protein
MADEPKPPAQPAPQQPAPQQPAEKPAAPKPPREQPAPDRYNDPQVPRPGKTVRGSFHVRRST